MHLVVIVEFTRGEDWPFLPTQSSNNMNESAGRRHSTRIDVAWHTMVGPKEYKLLFPTFDHSISDC